MEQEIELTNLLKHIWEQRKLIYKFLAGGLIIGLVVAFSIPPQYTNKVILAPESEKKVKGGFGDLASLAGFDLDDGGSGISLNIYPTIVKSTPFLLELSQIKVQRLKSDSIQTLYSFLRWDGKSAWWNDVLGAPIMAIRFVKNRILPKEEVKLLGNNSKLNPANLSEEEIGVLKMIKNGTSLSVEKKTGIITMEIKMQDPIVCYQVADSMINKLQSYITIYRTKKAIQDYEYAFERYNEAKEKYETAQQQYANYSDSQRFGATNQVKIGRDRLLAEQQLAYTTYAQMTQQLEIKKMKVQDQTPSFTVIEPASVPIEKTSMGKGMALVVCLFLSGFIATAVIVIRKLFFTDKKEA